ncbi:MAG TPA: F0F1 ATP synthase subunit A, partial [Bacilli bacterium]
VGFVQNLIGSTMDPKKGQRYIVLALTLILFIFVGNMLGLPFLIVTEHHEPFSLFGKEIISAHHLAEAEHHEIEISWWKSPTADVAVTMALATMVILMSHLLGLFTNTKAYLKHYFEPHWIMFPLNLVKEISRLFTLGLRLWGNILAGEILIGVIIGMLTWFGVVPLVVWLGFSTFVACIQAFVFTVLTLVYISLATQDPHAEEH